jgi:alanine-synthesizing transaminase
MEEFHKVRRLPPYVFEQVNRLKASARAAAAPTSSTSAWAIPTCRRPRHRRQAVRGGARPAHASLLVVAGHSGPAPRPGRLLCSAAFGVKLNPDTQVVATLGSKEGFANMAQAITAPGDVILCPNPTYPIHAFGFIMAGGVIRSFRLSRTRISSRRWSGVSKHSIPKPICADPQLSVEPDGAVASLDFYKDVVAFAKKHDIIILSDLAYSEIYFDGNPPPSVLQVPGAIDITVEFTSMSKTFSMPGWRMGFAVGNERLIAALTRVKSYLDYGAFTPIQVAATAALNGDGSDIAEVRDDLSRSAAT